VILDAGHRSLNERELDVEKAPQGGGGTSHASALASATNEVIDTHAPHAPAENLESGRKGKVLMIRRLLLTSSVLVSIAASPALAGSLHTSFVFITGSNNAYCVITNVNTKPIEVTATASTFAGNTATPSANNCPVPPNTLDAGASCYAVYNDDIDVACNFTAKGKARASMNVLSPANELVAVYPATAK
jgi:hypothetical protein